uniref:Ubiquitin carboxyl-terminal hydrolase n=1 Tax=Xenopsylla cheopis TaxID=163159 RepID=A0A6M2DM14_XENCH
MPVISGRYSATSGSSLPPSGTYRSSTLDRSYCGSSYITPRVLTHSRISSTFDSYRFEEPKKTYTSYQKYSKGLESVDTSRYRRSESRTRDETTQRERNDAVYNRVMATSAADIINKYSPANYVPKCELIRSRSLSDPRNMKEKSQEPTRERISSIRTTLPITTNSRSNSTEQDKQDKNIAGLNGLRNIGNTCFMNSVLQCLSNTRLLTEYVKNDSCCGEIGPNGALIKAFSTLICELWAPGSSRVINTSLLKSQVQKIAPRFMGYAQQDAQEFLRYLLEGLHEDINRVKTKPRGITTEIDDNLSDSQKAAESWARYIRMEDSHIVDLFVGQLKSTLKCTICGHSSVTFDPFWDLSLPIPSRTGQVRLNQCLELFTKEEVLDGDEKPTCSKCQVRRKCTKRFSVQKFPKILVIHLKRFSPTERFRGKLNSLVDFPLNELDLSSYAANQGTPCVYDLYAVSNHSGTTYSGHYTAYCKHPYTHEWHEYNDSRVSSISARNVVSNEAYVLFYELSNHHSSHL